jgi:hypothetical protein
VFMISFIPKNIHHGHHGFWVVLNICLIWGWGWEDFSKCSGN